MAIRDEYEVARLLTHPSFKELIFRSFGKDIDITYNLAPPFLTWFKVVTKFLKMAILGIGLNPVLRQSAIFRGCEAVGLIHLVTQRTKA